MKRLPSLIGRKRMSIGITGLCILCSTSLFFKYREQNKLQDTKNTYAYYETTLRSLERKRALLAKNPHGLPYQKCKEILQPKNRLIIAEIINQCASSLNEIRFRFEPETPQIVENTYHFKTSKIVIETSSFLDTDIFDFITNISQKIPAVFVLRKLSIRCNRSLLVSPHKDLSRFMTGEITYEWFSTDGEKNGH